MFRLRFSWKEKPNSCSLLTKFSCGPAAAFDAGSSLVALRKAGGKEVQGTLRTLRWLDTALGLCLGLRDAVAGSSWEGNPP